MSQAAVCGARTLVSDVRALIETLDESDWQAPSACPGWRVRDVIAHLAAFFAILADPKAAKPLVPADSAEALNDRAVDARRRFTVPEIRAEYEQMSERALQALEMMESPVLSSREVCMGDIGSYPLAAMSEAVCFDHLCHVVHDLLAPRGPVRQAGPPIDEQRLAPSLDWMLRGLPVMSGRGLAAVLERPLILNLSGPGGRRVRIERHGSESVVVSAAVSAGGDDVMSTDGMAFLAWATHRTPWQDSVRVDGDESRISAVLDRIRVV